MYNKVTNPALMETDAIPGEKFHNVAALTKDPSFPDSAIFPAGTVPNPSVKSGWT